MKTLLLIDGNAVMHRSYHALPPFKTKSGIPTGAVFGFLSILHKSITDFKPDHLVICFDTPAPTFRKKMFVKYQAQRPKIEADLIKQFPIVKEALDAAKITHLEKTGFEADDLIGTISHKFDKNGIKVLILSGDRDILQLVNKNVSVITPQIGFAKEKIYQPKEVVEKFGISAAQITDYKALAGDQSDNYKGAKGIGPKTAAKLVAEFGSVENLYKNIDTVDPKLKPVLVENKDNVILSKKLATILKDVKLDFNIEKSEFIAFNNNLKDFLQKFALRSLINRFFADKTMTTEKKSTRSEKMNKNQMGLF